MVLFAVRNKPFIRVQKVGDNPALGLLCQKFGVTPRVGVRATF